MKTFEKWLTEAHPEVLDEDLKKWARNLALAGTIGAVGCGLGGCGFTKSKPSVDKPTSTKSWIQQIRNDNARMRQQAAELKRHGLKQGTFVQGKLQGVPDSEPEGESSWTAPNAGDYLK